MPIYEHPISIRLTSKVASDGAGWGISTQTWASDIHRAGFTAQPSINNPAAYIIPNTWINPKAFADPTNANPEIGVTYVGEFSNSFFAPDGGGMFIRGTGTVQNYQMDGKSGAKTFSVTSQLNAFKTLGTTLQGTTAFNLIIHGQNDAVFGQTGPSGGQVYFEYSGVTGNSDAGFSSDFYKQGSSWVTFNSIENTTPVGGGGVQSATPTLNQFWVRKSFNYNYISLNKSQLAGIDIRGTTSGSLIYLDGLLLFDLNTVAGLSVGAICTFNKLSFDVALASRTTGDPPLNISTANQTTGLTFTYLGITAGRFNNARLFRMDMSGSSGSLFAGASGTATIPISGKIAIGVTPSIYDPTGNPYTIATNRETLHLRMFNDPLTGSRNLVEYFSPVTPTATNPRLFKYTNAAGTVTEPNHLGITGGSYITIRGGGNTGTYRITNIYRGIPGDVNESESFPIGGSQIFTSKYEYLELSNPIVPNSTVSTQGTVTISNVTDKPRLIIKYT